MEAPSIDTLLKVAPPAAKAQPINAPREDGEQFSSYLREAVEPNAASSEEPVAKSAMTTEKPEEEQLVTTATGQEGSSATPDKETLPAEVAEVETTTEEVTEVIADEASRDELILSVAAGALVEAEVQEIPTEVVVEIPTEVAAIEKIPIEAASENSAPESNQAPNPGQHIVDPADPTTTDSGQEAQPEEKIAPPSTVPIGVESVEVSKNSGLTPTVELPKSVAAPKSTKPIVPVATTESEDKGESSETSESEPAKVKPAKLEASQVEVEKDEPEKSEATKTEGAKVVESLTKIVDAPVVTSETNAKEAGTEASSPTPSASSGEVINGSQDQSRPIQTDATRTEAPAPHADGDSHMPTIDRTRFVQRVANAFRSAQQNDGQIQMRLSPPELGSLKIEIAVRNGVLSANLETETADARRVIMDNLPALRQRLAEQDIRIEKFEVDIRREGNPQQGQAEAQQQQTEQQSQQAMARNRIRRTQQHEAITTPRALLGKPAVAPGGLDVRV